MEKRLYPLASEHKGQGREPLSLAIPEMERSSSRRNLLKYVRRAVIESRNTNRHNGPQALRGGGMTVPRQTRPACILNRPQSERSAGELRCIRQRRQRRNE